MSYKVSSPVWGSRGFRPIECQTGMHVIRPAAIAALILAGSLQTTTAQEQAAPQVPTVARVITRGPSVSPFTSVRPDAMGTIQGNALNSTNGQLANAAVRLRDARFGRIVDSQVTDNTGLFTFKALDPGSYIVEMIGSDHSILAASQVLNINGGEAISAVVKLPFRIPPFAGILGNATPTTAAAVTAEAAASSVLAVTNVGEPTCP
jgi:hypothetical protein